MVTPVHQVPCFVLPPSPVHCNDWPSGLPCLCNQVAEACRHGGLGKEVGGKEGPLTVVIHTGHGFRIGALRTLQT
jgi:hypothetical protein